jgi:hypothetical protein
MLIALPMPDIAKALKSERKKPGVERHHIDAGSHRSGEIQYRAVKEFSFPFRPAAFPDPVDRIEEPLQLAPVEAKISAVPDETRIEFLKQIECVLANVNGQPKKEVGGNEFLVEPLDKVSHLGGKPGVLEPQFVFLAIKCDRKGILYGHDPAVTQMYNLGVPRSLCLTCTHWC